MYILCIFTVYMRSWVDFFQRRKLFDFLGWRLSVDTYCHFPNLVWIPIQVTISPASSGCPERSRANINGFRCVETCCRSWGMCKWRIRPLWISSVGCKTFLTGLVSTSSSFRLTSIFCWSSFPSLSASDPLTKTRLDRSWWDRHAKPEEGERAACLPCALT